MYTCMYIYMYVYIYIYIYIYYECIVGLIALPADINIIR